ncbi:ACT domain-containing protein [Maricaulis sp. D1M11]|uniref:ACT domain-containing protein n=1 Tax=Maricaulis sp. D1M11 TaxID=3076117 RepID=UPI0039B3A325
MRLDLTVDLFDTEGALLRLVGLVERRGFVINAMHKAQPTEGISRIQLQLDPRDSGRRADVLTRQIERLFDVSKVHTPDTPDTTYQIAGTQTAGWSEPCPPRH